MLKHENHRKRDNLQQKMTRNTSTKTRYKTRLKHAKNEELSCGTYRNSALHSPHHLCPCCSGAGNPRVGRRSPQTWRRSPQENTGVVSGSVPDEYALVLVSLSPVPCDCCVVSLRRTPEEGGVREAVKFHPNSKFITR